MVGTRREEQSAQESCSPHSPRPHVDAGFVEVAGPAVIFELGYQL